MSKDIKIVEEQSAPPEPQHQPAAKPAPKPKKERQVPKVKAAPAPAAQPEKSPGRDGSITIPAPNSSLARQ